MSNLQSESEYMTLAKLLIPIVIVSITSFIPSWYWHRGISHCKYNPDTQQCQCEDNNGPAPCLVANFAAKQPQAAREKERTQEETTTRWFKPDWLIVYVTLAYVIFAGLQWRAISQQSRLAKDTAKRQLRAYICVDSSMLKFPPAMRSLPASQDTVLDYTGPMLPGPVEAQVHIKNCGQTPAYDVRTWIHTWQESHPLKVPLPQPPKDFQMAKGIIGPSGTNVMIAAKTQPLSFEELNLLGTPEHTVYVYGEITYKDAFADRRCTKFRLIFGGPHGGRKNIIRGTLSGIFNPDTEGNDAN